jgi:N-acylneuraminate cytidylyltransferase
MHIVTVIPARGGSKSIPLKNIQPLNGKPLIAYSIEYSRSCPFVSETIVSTDSVQIAKIAEDCGARVPFVRPADISADDTQDFPVMVHALRELERLRGYMIDFLILLRPTSPLRPPGLIEEALEIINSNNKFSSVRSVVESSEHSYRQWKLCEDHMVQIEAEVIEPYNIPRQMLPKRYFQSGDIELIRRKTLIDGSVSGNCVAPLFLDRGQMLDIDFMSDLLAAEKRLFS